MKLKNIDTSREKREDYEALVPTGGMRVIDPWALPVSVRQACGPMLNKCPWVYAIASGSVSGDTTYCFIPARVDDKRPLLDLDPAAVVFHGDRPALSGCLRHHSDYGGRSVPLPPALWQSMLSGTFIGYCPLPGLPTTTSGALADLNSPVVDAAFQYISIRLSGC
jgi:hypothetical protein